MDKKDKNFCEGKDKIFYKRRVPEIHNFSNTSVNFRNPKIINDYKNNEKNELTNKNEENEMLNDNNNNNN